MPRGTYKENNQCGRKYSINEDYFEKIDSEEKAYFLGFIFADGNVASSKKSYTLRLHLHSQDEEILHKLKSALNSNAPIRTDKRGYVIFSVSSKKLVQDLVDLGACVAKTFKIRFPHSKIPPNMVSHFVRGYFDGDGSFSCGPKKSQLNFRIISNEKFILDIQEILIEQADLSKTQLIKTKSDGIKVIAYTGRNNFLKFYSFIYQASNIFLSRKKDKADKLLKASLEVLTKPYYLISPTGEVFEQFKFDQISKLGGPCKRSIYKMLENGGSVKGWNFKMFELGQTAESP